MAKIVEFAGIVLRRAFAETVLGGRPTRVEFRPKISRHLTGMS